MTASQTCWADLSLSLMRYAPRTDGPETTVGRLSEASVGGRPIHQTGSGVDSKAGHQKFRSQRRKLSPAPNR